MTPSTPFIFAPRPEQLEETRQLRDWLEAAQGFARPQISQFRVGALALGESGRLYMGCNLEFQGLDFAYTVHAEQFALAMAHQAEEHRIAAMFVTAMPCGHCRQFLVEAGHPELPIRVMDQQGRLDVTLNDLLLFPFTLTPGRQNLLTPHSAALILKNHQEDPLINLAVKAADRAYVPHTQSYAGLALALSDGRTVSGCSLESAAYNPTFTPLQMALCQLVSLQAPYEAIERAVLVQVEQAPVSYENHVQSWLKTVAPQASFQIEKAVIARL